MILIPISTGPRSSGPPPWARLSRPHNIPVSSSVAYAANTQLLMRVSLEKNNATQSSPRWTNKDMIYDMGVRLGPGGDMRQHPVRPPN